MFLFKRPLKDPLDNHKKKPQSRNFVFVCFCVVCWEAKQQRSINKRTPLALLTPLNSQGAAKEQAACTVLCPPEQKKKRKNKNKKERKKEEAGCRHGQHKGAGVLGSVPWR